MKDATSLTYGFLANLFQFYTLLIQNLIKNSDIPLDLRNILIAVYTVAFVFLLFLLFWFLKFLLTLVAKGMAAVFSYFAAALDNPRSVAYVAVVVLVQTVPWYFTLLFSILGFCGIVTLITDSPVWTESFKCIMGATVGSLIGVVKKQEQIEVEGRLFGILEEEAVKAATVGTLFRPMTSAAPHDDKPQTGAL